MEAFDQTYGSGGKLYTFVGGVGFTFVDLYFEAREEGSSIDFIVNIFGEPVTTNPGELLTSAGQKLHEERIVKDTNSIVAFTTMSLREL